MTRRVASGWRCPNGERHVATRDCEPEPKRPHEPGAARRPRAAPVRPVEVRVGRSSRRQHSHRPSVHHARRRLSDGQDSAGSGNDAHVWSVRQPARRPGDVRDVERADDRSPGPLHAPADAQVRDRAGRRAGASRRHSEKSRGDTDANAEACNSLLQSQNSSSLRTASTTRAADGMYASSICQYGYGTS
jgi:hypothetical protein